MAAVLTRVRATLVAARRREPRAVALLGGPVLIALLLLVGTVVLVLREPPPPAAGWVDAVDGDFRRGTGFWKAGKAWKWKGHHTGVDYEAAAGTPVVAAGPGTISVEGPGGAYGKHVEIDHGTVDGRRVITLYAHLSRYAGVGVGDRVQAGDRIGYVGETGNAFGPHLHFEVRLDWAGGVSDAEFTDGWRWIDEHRAPAPGLGGPPTRPTGRAADLDSDDGPPR